MPDWNKMLFASAALVGTAWAATELSATPEPGPWPVGRRQKAPTISQRRKMKQAQFALPIVAQSEKFRRTHAAFAGAYPMDTRKRAAAARRYAIKELNRGNLTLKEAQTIYRRTSDRWGYPARHIVKVRGKYTATTAPKAAAARRRAA